MLTPLTKAQVQSILPARKSDAHKGSFGSLVVIGGADGMQGALLLATRTALLSGSGRVFAVSLANAALTIDTQHPEIMYRHMGWMHSEANPATAYAVGPGLGQSALALECLTFCLQQPLPVLLDADALNLVALHPHLQALMQQRLLPTVITPHPAEAHRLLGQSIDYIQQHREASARLLAQHFKAICVLKGAGSLVVAYAHHQAANDRLEPCFINTTGNVALATAGTGDVLTGLIGSFMAQDISCLEAAKLGVYLHGAAADALVAKVLGPIGLTASEVALEIRLQLNQL